MSHGLSATSAAGEASAVNVRREAIQVALAAAEASWLAAAVSALGAGWGRHPALLLWLGLLIILLGFFYGYRALVQTGLPVRWQQAALVAALLAAIVFVVRVHVYGGMERPAGGWLAGVIDRLSDLSILISAEMLVALLLILMWGRAMHLAQRSLSTDSVGLTFRAGVVILTWLSLAIALLRGPDVTPFVVPYFFFALVAVALARIEEVSHLPGGSQAQFSGYWVGSSVAAVAALTLAGMGVAAIIAGSVQPLLRLFSPILFVVFGLLLAVALLIYGLLEALVDWLHLDLGSVGQAFRDLLDRLGQMAAGLRESTPGPGVEPETLRGLHLGGNLLVIAAVIAVVLVLTWMRLRHVAGRPMNETRESLPGGAQHLAQELAGLLRGARRRLADLAGLVSAGRLLAALSIRRIYANLGRLAAEAGYPRGAAQTPDEYLPTLARAFPDCQAETALITAAYVQAHYGRVPDTAAELQRIRDAWERVRAGQVSKLS